MVRLKALVEVEGVLSCHDAANALGWGIATLWRRLADNTLHAVRIGGRTVIPASEVERILEAEKLREAKA